MIHQGILDSHQENPILLYIQFIHYIIIVKKNFRFKRKFNLKIQVNLDVSTITASDDPWVFRTSLSQLLSKISRNDLTRDSHHHHHHHHHSNAQNQSAMIKTQPDIDINTARIQFKDIICYFSLLEGGSPEQKLECKIIIQLFFFI
jgi:hypothetical protein